jgi:hypothetical protein
MSSVTDWLSAEPAALVICTRYWPEFAEVTALNTSDAEVDPAMFSQVAPPNFCH